MDSLPSSAWDPEPVLGTGPPPARFKSQPQQINGDGSIEMNGAPGEGLLSGEKLRVDTSFCQYGTFSHAFDAASPYYSSTISAWSTNYGWTAATHTSSASDPYSASSSTFEPRDPLAVRLQMPGLYARASKESLRHLALRHSNVPVEELLGPLNNIALEDGDIQVLDRAIAETSFESADALKSDGYEKVFDCDKACELFCADEMDELTEYLDLCFWKLIDLARAVKDENHFEDWRGQVMAKRKFVNLRKQLREVLDYEEQFMYDD